MHYTKPVLSTVAGTVVLATSMLFGTSAFAGNGDAQAASRVPAVVAPQAAASPDDLVRDVIVRIQAALNETAQDEQQQAVALHGVVETHVMPLWDMSRTARLVLGKHWRRATHDQREAFTREFRQLLLRTYSASFSDGGDARIKVLPLRPASTADAARVQVEIKPVSGPVIPVQFSMHRKSAAWQVYDVRVDGISLVTNYRANFSAIIRNTGVDGLIAQLVERNRLRMSQLYSGTESAGDSRKRGH